MKIEDGLLYYNISDSVTAFTTTREGGCSIGAYASFNVNKYCGDDSEHVRQNQEHLCRKLDISRDCLLMPHQIHKTDILTVDGSFLSYTEDEKQRAMEGVDALITDRHNVAICVSTADCIPVVVYDTVHHATAAIHAGWRGTVARIVEKVMDRMNTVYGTRGEDCKAVIGPGISLDSFEVGDEVYDTFESAGFDMNGIAERQAGRKESDAGKWHIDLWECNRRQLISKKIDTGNILIAGICTFKNYDKFFSARRLGINSGRLLTGIILR